MDRRPPRSPPIGLDSFSYLSCVFAARSASVSHLSAISMNNDLCAEVRASSANRMHSAAFLRNWSKLGKYASTSILYYFRYVDFGESLASLGPCGLVSRRL